MSANFPRLIRCMHVGDSQNLAAHRRRLDHRQPRAFGNPAPLSPSVDRVVLLIQGGRQRNVRGLGPPNREYVVKGLHKPPYLTDYLSVQERTEKQVTPLFRQLTMLDMKGTRKASTPSQWRDQFIERVKSARIVSGKKPVEVAAALGVNLDTYNRWETRALLPHHLVMPFCAITGADPVMLLTGSPFDLGKLLKRTSHG